MNDQQTRIRELIRARRAILLAHYYQRDEIQEIADFVGDSLALSIEAARTDAAVIVFAGVHFMAESAAILSPDKTVLLPRLDAGCPLADAMDADQLAAARKAHPEAVVITYVNSSAAVKALSDACCTSANAVAVAKSFGPDATLLLGPDGNLARWVARQVPNRVIPWQGACPVHDALPPDAVRAMKARHPGALFAAHPECPEAVLDLADFVGSTSGIIRYAGEPQVRDLIVGTEQGVFYQLKQRYPDKTFLLADACLTCDTMKVTTLDDIEAALAENRHVIRVPGAIAAAARKALDRMIAA